jgi:hypothetical protein
LRLRGLRAFHRKYAVFHHGVISLALVSTKLSLTDWRGAVKRYFANSQIVMGRQFHLQYVLLQMELKTDDYRD